MKVFFYKFHTVSTLVNTMHDVNPAVVPLIVHVGNGN